MNTMPGFTAEASLKKMIGQYLVVVAKSANRINIKHITAAQGRFRTVDPGDFDPDRPKIDVNVPEPEPEPTGIYCEECRIHQINPFYHIYARRCFDPARRGTFGIGDSGWYLERCHRRPGFFQDFGFLTQLGGRFNSRV